MEMTDIGNKIPDNADLLKQIYFDTTLRSIVNSVT